MINKVFFGNKIQRGVLREDVIPSGVDYALREDIKRPKKDIIEINNTRRNRTMTSQEQTELILSHYDDIKSAADSIIKDHPELEFDDIVQDLMVIAYEVTKENYCIPGNSFNRVFNRRKNQYIKTLNEQPTKETKISIKDFEEKLETKKIEEEIKKARKEELNRVISSNKNINERDKAILKEYYESDDQTQTLRELGNKYYITGSRIHQIINETIRKLKSPKVEAKLEDTIYIHQKPIDEDTFAYIANGSKK